MKKRMILTGIIMTIVLGFGKAQDQDIPVVIKLKDGKTIDAKHFGQVKCGKDIYGYNYLIVRGKYLNAVTEIKKYNDIEKLVLQGFKKDPIASVGNERSVIRIVKSDGNSYDLEEAELAMSCYGTGDKYNEIVVTVINPITNKSTEIPIETKDIQSIVFK